MSFQHLPKSSLGNTEIMRPTKFIVVCILAFISSVAATVYFVYSMGGEMKMPGGWDMSMMWMLMPDQTWLESALIFLLMWLAMMITMMMPSVLPMFLKTRRQSGSLCLMASGYFAIWLIAGGGIYVAGMLYGIYTMQSLLLSRIIPLLSGISLIAVGTIQFTSWKMIHLLRCRSPLGCAVSYSQNETSFRIGCKQGVACCSCCATLMAIQLVLGIMNPVVMIAVAISIAAEKLFPRPEIITRSIGIAAILGGAAMLVNWVMINYN